MRSPVATVAARRYRRALDLLEAGDLDAVLAGFSPSCHLSFVGDTPLGADLRTPEATRAWFERFLRLLPDRRFEVRHLVAAGTPWHVELAADVEIRSHIDGRPYRNRFAHFLTLRSNLVVRDLVIEDTQRWADACRRLTAAGITEAGAAPITD